MFISVSSPFVTGYRLAGVLFTHDEEELTFTALLVAVLASIAPGALAGVSLAPCRGHTLAPPTLVVTARVPGPVHHRRVLLRVEGAAGANLVTVLGRLEEVHKLVVYINFLQTS